MKFAFIFLILLTLSCSTAQKPKDSRVAWQEIAGRDEGNLRPVLYRAKVPLTWTRKDPDPELSNADTKLPICEFYCANDEIRITIHNFPNEALKDRIPPFAQIARWKKQFSAIELPTILIVPQAFNGFVGYSFKATGLMNDESKAMLAWIMQLAKEHYSNIVSQSQMKSDFTIKAVGNPEVLQNTQNEIEGFARSFELIQEIPQRL